MTKSETSSTNSEGSGGGHLPAGSFASRLFHSFRAVYSSWAPNVLDVRLWVVLAPFLIFFVLYWLSAKSGMRLMTDSFQFWEYIIFSLITEVCVYLIGLVVLLRFFRSPKLASAYAILYLAIYTVNIGMMHHAGALIDPYYISIMTWTNWMIYLTSRVYLVIGLLTLGSALMVYMIHRNAQALARIPLKGMILVLLLATGVLTLSRMRLIRPTDIVNGVVSVFATKAVASESPALESPVKASEAGEAKVRNQYEAEMKFTTPVQTAQLRYLSRNQLWILLHAIGAPRNILKEHSASELADLKEGLDALGIRMGEREYPSLGLKPIDHIIVFNNESLSLDFLSPYNDSLPGALTPFYGSPESGKTLLRNYRTVSLPTQAGVVAMYNSHPNTWAIINGGPELSFVKVLKKHGYHAIALKAGSETFASDHLLYKRLGFDELIGLETWMKDPRNKSYVDPRGFMDRVMFERLVEILKEYRGRKLYIHVAGQDTHSPVPRQDYGNLEYPPPPPELEKIANPEARALLTSFGRHDFDVGNAIRNIREEGLLTENTLVVVTADHCYPPSDLLRDVPGFRLDEPLQRIPFMLISGQPLPEADTEADYSQLDYAPTLVHLLGLPVRPGWWGESIYAPDRSAYVSVGSGGLSHRYDGVSRMIAAKVPEDNPDYLLTRLFERAYVEPAAEFAEKK